MDADSNMFNEIENMFGNMFDEIDIDKSNNVLNPIDSIDSILNELEANLNPFPEFSEFKSNADTFKAVEQTCVDSLKVKQLRELRKRLFVIYDDEDFMGLFIQMFFGVII